MSQPQVSDWNAYRRLLGYVIPHWKVFMLSLLGYAIFSGSQIVMADMLQFIVDTISGTDELGKGMVASVVTAVEGGKPDMATARNWIAIVVVLIGVVRGIGFFVGNYSLHWVARRVVHALRCNVFDQLLYAPSKEFDQHASGFLISKITFNVEQVTGAATDALKIIVREGLFVIGLTAYLLYTNWKLSLVFAVALPVIGGIVYTVGKRFRRISKRIQHSVGDVTQVSSEVIGGYREVRMFGGTERERSRFHAVSDYNREQSLKMAFYNAISPPVIQLPVIVALAALLWIGLGLVGEMTGGEFVAYITVAMLLPKPIRQIAEVNAVIQRGLAAATDIFEFMDSERERDQGSYEVERVNGDIVFDRVSFAYSDETPNVLSDINLAITPGQTVALVGLSGSGKSTLVSLLARFYNHTKGKILLDGVDVNDYRLDSLRQQISLVTQQVTLFNDTVYNNIAYGELANRSREEVLAAIKAAHAEEFIEKLPQGLETMIGEDGTMLSGGQRQRLAIARALLKDAPLLILDEATSALDNRAESHIQAALESAMKGRTTIVIAHRLSTVENADVIVVMEEGRIVERGSHQQLLEQKGRYAELYERQFDE